MFSRLATPLFAKVAVGLVGALLAAILILWLLLKAESARADKWQTRAIQAEQSIVRIEKDADRRSKAAADELAKAIKANEALGGHIDRLKLSGSVTPAPGPCVISKALKDAEGEL